jgi:hypothetical protein
VLAEDADLAVHDHGAAVDAGAEEPELVLQRVHHRGLDPAPADAGVDEEIHVLRRESGAGDRAADGLREQIEGALAVRTSVPAW